MANEKEKTIIGVLTSHDDQKVNTTLSSIFEYLYKTNNLRDVIQEFHFVFTGGTYDRLFNGNNDLKLPPLKNETKRWLTNSCSTTRLPTSDEGGVTVLSYLISQRQCSIVWPFFSSKSSHWLRPENLAFFRLCDQWHVKKLMNKGSVLVWCKCEAEADKIRNLQKTPLTLTLFPDGPKSENVSFKDPKEKAVQVANEFKLEYNWTSVVKKFNEMTIALIAHDEMKGRMIEFAIDHEAELSKFKTILTTSSTGREVAAATTKKISEKMARCHSGPKGGDIEIATTILYDKCDIVIFFVDPLKPHPHIEDIRTVFQACMIKDQVVMITNEMHAREFMSRVVRGDNEELTLYQCKQT